MSPTLPPIQPAQDEAERINILTKQLKQITAADTDKISIVKVPLRICPLGAHIDHQLGNVTGLTLDQSLLLAFVPTYDNSVFIESTTFSPSIQFFLNQVPPRLSGNWGNYIQGAVLALQQQHDLKKGLIGVVSGDMPVGGLSSSAAVTSAYLLALETVNDLVVSPEENVELVRYTENVYIGLQNGILDQTVILCTQQDHLTYIDCESVSIKQIPISGQMPAFDILVIYSGVAKALTGTDYNNRVAECQEATRQLLGYVGQSVSDNPRLRHVSPEIFAAEGHRLPETLQQRAKHYFGEMDRVAQGVQAWQAGDIHALGKLMLESGESSIKNYQSGCPQLITLYEILSNTPGVHGARFSGAGFRGSCIALSDPAARQTIAETVHQHYPAQHPKEAESYSIHFCQASEPATIISKAAG